MKTMSTCSVVEINVCNLAYYHPSAHGFNNKYYSYQPNAPLCLAFIGPIRIADISKSWYNIADFHWKSSMLNVGVGYTYYSASYEINHKHHHCCYRIYISLWVMNVWINMLRLIIWMASKTSQLHRAKLHFCWLQDKALCGFFYGSFFEVI